MRSGTESKTVEARCLQQLQSQPWVDHVVVTNSSDDKVVDDAQDLVMIAVLVSCRSSKDRDCSLRHVGDRGQLDISQG